MKTTLLLLCMLLLPCGLHASEDIAFKHLGTRQGLSNACVYFITRDSQGFMWFCTASGLNRYDGYGFKVFMRNSKDPTAITDNFVEQIVEDADGGLWMKTSRRGYLYYDPRKETFEPAAEVLEARFGIAGNPHRIYVDKAHNIWCHVQGVGTYQCNVQRRSTFFYATTPPGELSNHTLCHITEEARGIMHIYDNGLIEILDRQTNQVIHRNDYLCRAARKEQQYSLFVDADGDYWVYTKNNTGLWFYNAARNTWQHCSTDKHSPFVLTNNHVYDVKQDLKGRIWIATDHGGINLIDKQLRTTTCITNNPLNERSLAQNSLTSLYCDETGIMWVGTFKCGISYHAESIFKFKVDHLNDLSHAKDFLPDVNTIVEDRQANLWLGTNSSGMVLLNRHTRAKTLFGHNPHNPKSLSSNVIVCMLAARNGDIWVGTYQGGLNRFDGKTFTHYRHHPDNANSLAGDNVWALAEDENGLLWIGTLGNGLQSLDPATGRFTTYAEPGTTFATDYITSICITKDKSLLMSTAEGLTHFTPAKGTFERLNGNRSGTRLFSHQNMNQVFEDSRGLLWVATQEGLNIYDRKQDELYHFDAHPLLHNHIVNAIEEDGNKNMWVTTTQALFNIVVTTNPQAGTYAFDTYRYDEADGLKNQGFNQRAILKTREGEIIVGGVRGLSLFDPEHIKYNDAIPQVVFTGLQLFNTDVKPDSLYDGKPILKQTINRSTEVQLAHSQNMFSLSFSAMNYALPEKTRYTYMLEGFNNNWLTADANKVTYTNLAPGKYTFKVKAINGDGYVSRRASELRIVVRPPFRQSPLAYLLYALLFAGLLLLARWQLLRTAHNKFRLTQVEEEARRKHEIDDMKLRFFTNISHELRTPLALIISPLENLMKTSAGEEQTRKLEMIHRNAVRLLNMVNQLLDFRKSDVKGHQLNPTRGDVVEYIGGIAHSFAEFSEKKNVHLTFFSSVKTLSMVFDEDKLGKIIMNLLSNAFKFTGPGGRVDVSLRLLPATETAPEQLEIRVADTGIGIADEDKQRIFERFYQIQHPDAHKVSGSGVGLHLVKEFVSLHSGTVSVHDNVGQGSVFMVTLPVVRPQTPEAPDTPATDPTDTRPMVLVVDDSDDFRLFMRDSLKADYRVEEAPDGLKARELITLLQPDIIVSDVMMPGMDGFELSRCIKNDVRTSHIPVILLTARSAEAQKLEGLESGADDYITKPFNFEILNLRIKKLLQLRQQRQENFRGQIEVKPSDITITSLDETLIKKAVAYVEANMNRCELSVEELSHELGMSRVHLYKKLTSITGKSPIEFIRIIRLKRGAQLLRESQLNVSEVAYAVGFNNPKAFAKYFKEEFGVLPSAYQQKAGK